MTDYRLGNYRAVAERLRPAAERLVALAEVGADDVVVDVAAGSGNVAKQCAARRASVVAVDVVLEQLQLGRDDTPVHWVAGDAHALPIRDDVATRVLSTFGLIYASDPARAVAESARVARPGGLLGLTAWPSGGYQEASANVLRDVLAGSAAGHDHIAAWGSRERIESWLAPVATDVDVQTGDIVARHPSMDDWWEHRVATAPPIATARENLDDDEFADFANRMKEVARQYATDDGEFVLRDTYLLALARVR